MFRCVQCGRDLDIMTDGCHELMNCTEICDKCMYGEWKDGELSQCKAALHENECGCSNGCEWCLCVEPRIGRF